MKYKNFLDDNFGLWFFFWFLTTLVSSLIYKFINNEIGLLLLRFDGMLLIALLTAMAAFNNMDINEKKKKAREEYYALQYYIHCLVQRFNCLYQVYQNIEDPIKSESFARGLYIPYVLIDFETNPIKFNEISYFSANIKSTKHQLSEENNCINIVYLSGLELQYRSLIKVIELRNEIMKEKIMPITNASYIGAGQSDFHVDVFKDTMNFAEFSNFLHTSEHIMSAVVENMLSIKKVIKGLSKKAKDIISEEIANENGGYPEFILPKWNEKTCKYHELKNHELLKFNSNNYPKISNYSNYNSLSIVMTWSDIGV